MEERKPSSSIFDMIVISPSLLLLLSLSTPPSSPSPVPKTRLVEGSEFLNEDSSKVSSGLNGKSNQWSFEELIDLNVHTKARPLMEADDCNQVLIHCDGGSDGTRVAFEDKGTPVSGLHPSSQPLEALSGEEQHDELCSFICP